MQTGAIQCSTGGPLVNCNEIQVNFAGVRVNECMVADEEWAPVPDNEIDDDEKSESPANTEILDDFASYSEDSLQNHCNLFPDAVAAVELLDMITKSRAPLGLYDEILRWHAKHHEVPHPLRKDALLSKLKKRYNANNTGPKVLKNVYLPHSRSRVTLVVHDFKYQLESLLSDPRFGDDDYLFFNDNPFQAPPAEFTHVGDINTGRAYRETYKKLIRDPDNEVLLPIIFYMDGAVTGQYDHLPIEALKFTIGIFNAEARDRGIAWRPIGYVTKFQKEETKAKDLMFDSANADANDYLFCSDSDDDYKETDDEQEIGASENEPSDIEEQDDDDLGPPIPSCSGQDLHKMMDKMLESYAEVEHGVTWNLRYRGSTYPVIFKPFILFVKGDGKEHDKHCGHYGPKSRHIQQLCRTCSCPTDDTDDPWKRYPNRDPETVQALIDMRDSAGLQQMSQLYIENTWFKRVFGFHNTRGIFGACPSEVLHWFQINKYKYARNMFFAQAGFDSKLSDELDAVAKATGFLFKRKSDRDYPRTEFNKGIKKGKLMAHEMTGVILVLIATIRCTRGRNLLLDATRQREYFGNLNQICDWIMYLESLLHWEAWLNLPEIQVEHIVRSEVKVRHLMELEKVIGNRQTGMGFKTHNFHACVHIADDMLDFRVPSNVNTRSNESHHKPDKKAALRTQRRAKTFDLQCAQQMHINNLASEGMNEVTEGQQRWLYLHNRPPKDGIELNRTENDDMSILDRSNTGAKVYLFRNPESDDFVYKISSEMKDKHRFKLDEQLIDFLVGWMETLQIDNKRLLLFTEHKRGGEIFRATPYFMGKPWRDWVTIDWGEEDGGVLPCHIAIFVDLTNIPDNNEHLSPGTYAVVESASLYSSQQEQNLGQIFEPYRKDFKKMSRENTKTTVERQYYLADVDAIASPMCMIPDLGNPHPGAFFKVHPRQTWAKFFMEWLESDFETEFPNPEYAQLV